MSEQNESKEGDVSPALEESAEVRGETAQKTKKKPMDVSRRSLFVGVGGTVVLLAFGATRYIGHTPVPRPPGGQDEAHLVNACIRCEKCYEACPRNVIIPTHIEDGLLGMRTPQLSFESGYCDFCQEENGGIPKCAQTCPTDALKLPEYPASENAIIGRAVLDQHQCLAYRDTGCHYCVDACPLEAITYESIESKEKALHPVVINELCNGCGACESVCVSLTAGSIVSGATERAIVVKPLSLL